MENEEQRRDDFEPDWPAAIGGIVVVATVITLVALMPWWLLALVSTLALVLCVTAKIVGILLSGIAEILRDGR